MSLEPGRRSWRLIALDLGEFIVELLKVVLISMAIIFPVRYYVVQPFYVKGASMEPSFFDHEYLVIDELSYRFYEPARGDVVVFRYPRDPRQFFIKRIIGLPGETVRIQSGSVTVVDAQHPDGFRLPEKYLESVVTTSGEMTVSVGAGEYFLSGDNRPTSLDSRIFGVVPTRYLVGRVWLRAWPVSRWTVFRSGVMTAATVLP